MNFIESCVFRGIHFPIVKITPGMVRSCIYESTSTISIDHKPADPGPIILLRFVPFQISFITIHKLVIHSILNVVLKKCKYILSYLRKSVVIGKDSYSQKDYQ